MFFKKELAADPTNFAFGNVNQTARRAANLFTVVLVGMVISGFAATAEARIFTVTKIADSDDNMCDADCSLREALGRANSETTDDVINFAPAVFNTPQTLVIPHVLTVFRNVGALTIDGPGANLLTLTRQAAGSGRIIYVDDSTLTLNGVTVAGGNMTGLGLQGGGIAKGGNGTLTINNCVITGNSSDTGGGIGVSGGLQLSIIRPSRTTRREIWAADSLFLPTLALRRGSLSIIRPSPPTEPQMPTATPAAARLLTAAATAAA
jgi:CSLREA domain-containing protein